MEFIRRWIAEYNTMQNSGETAAFRAMSEKCDPCLGIADQVDEIYANGGRIETSGWIPRSFRRTPSSSEHIVFIVKIRNSRTRYVERAGDPVKILPAGSGFERFELTRLGESFNVSDIAEQSQP
ncbi:MAG: hypothetical protein R2734_19035 [Nocardioides sp.]